MSACITTNKRDLDGHNWRLGDIRENLLQYEGSPL